MSVDAAKGFPDSTFDWIYVDGDHTHYAVLSNPETFALKVKQGSLILGHDYVNYPGTEELNFGVIEAVDAFLSSSRFDFLALTVEGHATFVLGDTTDALATDMLLAKIIYYVPGIIEIRDFSGKQFRQKGYGFPGDKLRLVISV